ncbi:MAG: flippase [Bacteroidota bacterium]
MTKSQKNSYWLNSGIYTFGQRLSTSLFGFAGFYFLVRCLDKPSFGVWALFISVTALIEVARNGLIQNAQIKFAAAATPEEYPVILKASIVLNIILTGVSVVVLLILGPVLAYKWDAPVLKEMFWLYTLTTISLIPFSQFNFIQQANLDFKGIFWSWFIRQALFFGSILYVYFDHHVSLHRLSFGMLLSSIAASAASWFFVRKFLKLAPGIDWDWVKKLFNYGKFTFATNVSGMISGNIDQMLLGSMKTKQMVAEYNTSFRIQNLIDVPISTMAQVVFPQSVSRMATEGTSALKYLYERSVGVTLALIIPAVIFVQLFPDFVIYLIAGKDYENAVHLLRLTILYSLISPFTRQFGTIMDSLGKPHMNFYFVLCITILNTGCNYVFIRHFGLEGAAYGTLTSMSIALVIAGYILRKETGIQYREVLRHMIKSYPELFRFVTRRLGFNKPTPVSTEIIDNGSSTA